MRLFLFGSRANGTATKDSDSDFVMAVPNPKKSSLLEMIKARSLSLKSILFLLIFLSIPQKNSTNGKTSLVQSQRQR